MKILLANYRYFFSGGPERYLFNLQDALEESGHEIVPFSIRYAKNEPTPYSHYFVEPLGNREEVYFREHKITPKTLWRILLRLIYAPDVEQAVVKLVHDTNPQIAYILHYLRKLSPSLLVGLKKTGLPIVVRLSDYAMLCPQAHFLRNDTPCNLCANGNLLPSLKYRCVQGSLPASVLNMIATKFHHVMQYFDLVDMFVVTTRFMYHQMISVGYPENKLCYIPTFVDSTIFHPTAKNAKEKYIVYVGRLEHIKGVHVLIDAFALLLAENPEIELKLKIAGTGDEQYSAALRKKVDDLGLAKHVRFMGDLSLNQVANVLNKAYVSVVPSLWYENLPNVILESYASGTPVLASNLGSLPECVEEGCTGYLFQLGNARHLAERLLYCFNHPEHVVEMGMNSRTVAETTYSEALHLDKLSKLFTRLVEGRAL